MRSFLSDSRICQWFSLRNIDGENKWCQSPLLVTQNTKEFSLFTCHTTTLTNFRTFSSLKKDTLNLRNDLPHKVLALQARTWVQFPETSKKERKKKSWVHAFNASSGKTEIGEFLGLTGQLAYPNWRVTGLGERPCFITQGEKFVRNDSWTCPLTYTCTCTYVCMCTHAISLT